MAGRKSNSIGGDVGSAIGTLSLFGAIAAAISGWLRINFLLAAVILLVGLAGLFLIVPRVSSIIRLILAWREKSKPCAHGVKAGSASPCVACKDEAAHREELEKQRTEERNRVAEIRKHAQSLRAQEIDRLSRAWLTTSKSYTQ